MFEAATCQQMYRENVAPVLGRWTRELHHRIRSDVTAAMTEERPSKRKAAGDLRREDVDAESGAARNTRMRCMAIGSQRIQGDFSPRDEMPASMAIRACARCVSEHIDDAAALE